MVGVSPYRDRVTFVCGQDDYIFIRSYCFCSFPLVVRNDVRAFVSCELLAGLDPVPSNSGFD